MDLTKKNWFNKNLSQRVVIKRAKGVIEVENQTDTPAYIVCASPVKTSMDYLSVSFKGEIRSTGHCLLHIHDIKKNRHGTITLNSESIIKTDRKKLLFVLEVQSNTSVTIREMGIEEMETLDSFYSSQTFSDFLIISPSYPSPENKYLSGFVHSRLKAYKKAGIKFTLVCAFDYQEYSRYEFEDIEVIRVPFDGLRTILRLHDFKKIAVHFFDWRYARILDASNLLGKELYFWVHGPETLYWDWPSFTTGYFQHLASITPEQSIRFEENDLLIRRYNEMGNVRWIFVSEWIKNRSEELINIKFCNYSVIPNFIDSDNFIYLPKDSEQRKKIFMLRRYDNINKYAVDIAVRAIRTLSEKSFFNKLEFNIYGTGDSFDRLFKPLLGFDNIKFHKEFFTHEEIAKIHQGNGIALFPTRYDAQGVSMCEAAMSGLAVVSSDNDAIKEFIPSVDGNLVKTEDYQGYAKQIEKLYKNPEYFQELSKASHEEVLKKCSFGETVNKEIALFSEHKEREAIIPISRKKSKDHSPKILTVIVPSYNVQDFLMICVNSLLNHENRNSVEVLIVNDGSTDGTLKVAQELENLWNSNGADLIKIIDKENGGHGSTINVGIRNASGKYVRIVDSDDWVNSSDLSKLIDFLREEDSDLVLTNYSQDIAERESLFREHLYESLTPGIKYKFDDLCSDDLYGFNKWGPILATSNFKTEILKKANFMLTEKSPYVDMEFNMYSIEDLESVVFYDLDIYRYFIGREGQTISKSSFMRNYLKHEKILLNMIDYVSNTDSLSSSKRGYVDARLIEPMIKSQYLIVSDYFRSPQKFREFNSKLKEYPEYYNASVTRKLNIFLGRKTWGLSVLFMPIYNKLASNKSLDTLAIKIKKIILNK